MICPGRGCAKRIGPDDVACPRCYLKLPATLRTQLRTNWADNNAYHAHVADAHTWLGSMACTPASDPVTTSSPSSYDSSSGTFDCGGSF